MSYDGQPRHGAQLRPRRGRATRSCSATLIAAEFARCSMPDAEAGAAGRGSAEAARRAAER